MHKLLNDDALSRFAFDRQKDVRRDGSARSSLLKPKAGESLSVFLTTGMTHPTICVHGHSHADNPEIGRIHFGYVTLNCGDVRAEGLEPFLDNSPPRHVSIAFNADEPERRLAIAQALANKASHLEQCDQSPKETDDRRMGLVIIETAGNA